MTPYDDEEQAAGTQLGAARRHTVGVAGARFRYRRALEDSLHRHGLQLTTPAQEFSSNAAVRIAASAGVGPAVLSEYAVDEAIGRGELVEVPLAGEPLLRDLRAVWIGPVHPSGAAGDLVRVSRAGLGARSARDRANPLTEVRSGGRSARPGPV